MRRTLISILLRPRALVSIFVVVLSVVTAVLWYQNYSLYLLGLQLAPTFLEKIQFFFGTYGALLTNFSLMNLVALIVLANLLGVYIVLFVAYIRRSRSPRVGVGSLGFFGFIAGLFGVGCAACGVIIFSSIFGLVGGGAVLAALPLHGNEFMLFGILILLVSNYYLLKKLADPLVCPIE